MSTRTPEARRPGAFRLDDPAVVPAADLDDDALEPGGVEPDRALELIVRGRRGFGWGAVALSAAGALASLAVGIWLDQLIRELFGRADWLGWLGLGLMALLALAIAAMVARELVGLFRLKRVAQLRLDSDAAAAGNDRAAALAAVRGLLRLYSGRADTARARTLVSAHLREIMDGRDLLRLAERDLLAPLDAQAKALVAASARRVSVVTAVSPRAFLDMLFVLWEAVRLIRRLAVLYGGRPGTLGMLRLLKAVLTHLAVTGSLAIGDTLLQQVVGHGIAGRLSAKFGEGLVNGIMTARIGLSALDVCRPFPFLELERPRLKDIAAELVSWRDREKAEI